MRHFYITIIFLFSALFTFSQSYNPAVESIIDDVNLDSLVFYLRNLSGEDSVIVSGENTIIEHRVSNWGNNLAAAYLKQTLEGYGLEVFEQDYSENGRNIYAVQEGTVFPDEYYMICAHYDAVDYYCADDNGSGSSAVLEAVRIFSELQFEYSIIFALWDEEEIGLIGSDYYASLAASNEDVIHAVINMDMISWDGDEDMVAEIHSSILANSNDLANYIMDVNELYNLLVNPLIQLPGITYSDHSKFWDNGYPAVLMIEEYSGGDFNPYYHTEADRIAILNMPFFHEMAKLSIGSLASLAIPLYETSIDEIDLISDVQLKCYPNPFTYETTLSYILNESANVRLTLINSQGKIISVLFDDFQSKGEHQLKVQAENLPKGLYFIAAQTLTEISTYKILIN